MKPCSICRDTSPDDAAFCITCGRAFGAVGATERLSSAGAQTQRVDGNGPSSIASAVPMGRRVTEADWAPSGSPPYLVVYAGGGFGVGTVYLSGRRRPE